MSLATKIKSHWRLDPDEGTGITEDAASTYDLDDINTTSNGTGKVGKCAVAVAANGEMLRHDDDDYFDLADNTAWSMWLQVESYFDGTSTRRAFTKRNQYEIWKTNAAYSPDLKLKIHPSSGSAVTVTLKSGLSTSQWVFVYFAVDGSNILWSVDGGAIQTGGALTSYKTASYRLEVGNYSGTGVATKIWNGGIDELSYWSDLLTQAQVESLWNSGNGVSFPHSSETSLVVSDPQHAHTSDTFAITQASDIVLADSQHAQTSDDVVLDTEVNLVAADSSHLHTAAHVPSEDGDGSLCMMHRNCILIG